MKNKLIFISISAAFFLVFASFPSVIANENIDNKLADKKTNTEKVDLLESVKEEGTNAKWFPGFLIVQLAKGVIALVLMLMILLDLAEPDDSEE